MLCCFYQLVSSNVIKDNVSNVNCEIENVIYLRFVYFFSSFFGIINFKSHNYSSRIKKHAYLKNKNFYDLFLYTKCILTACLSLSVFTLYRKIKID